MSAIIQGIIALLQAIPVFSQFLKWCGKKINNEKAEDRREEKDEAVDDAIDDAIADAIKSDDATSWVSLRKIRELRSPDSEK